MHYTKRLYCLLLPTLLQLPSHRATAQTPSIDTSQALQHLQRAPWFAERFKVQTGFFLTVNNTDVRIESVNGQSGTDLDFENDLGFNVNTGTFMANAQWRISRRSKLELSYFGIHRDTEYNLQKDIVFGENTYHVDNTIYGYFNTDIYRLSYGYALLSREKFEAGVLVGLHIVGIEVGIGIYGDNINTRNDRFTLTAPLPDVGLWGGYAFGNRWSINTELSYLSLTIGRIQGRVVNGNIHCNFRVASKLDMALGYAGFDFNVRTERKRLNGDLTWGYYGPFLTASYSFGRKSWR